MSRPKVLDTRLYLRISSSLKKKARKCAEKKDINFCEYLREAIEEKVDRDAK